MAKKAPTITLEQLMAEGEAFLLQGIPGGQGIALQPKKFKTGSYGWGADGGTRVTVVTKGGRAVNCIATVNLVVANSNPDNQKE